MNNKDKNLQLVQMLRGVAAILVVFFHSTANFKLTFNKPFCFDFFSFCAAGVDIFFVLSGFIITYTNLHNISKPKKLTVFVKRRFIRIFPTYWIIITVLLVVQLALPTFYKTKFPINWIDLLNTFFLLPNHIMLNGVSWTLTYELLFYFIFSFSFLIPSKRISLFIFLLYAIILLFFGGSDFSGIAFGKWWQLILFPMNLEFIMGIMIGIFVKRLNTRLAIPFIIFGIILFIYDGVLIDKNIFLFTAFNRVVLFGIPSCFIISGIIKYELENKIALNKLFLDLGEASYSIYLVHLPVIVAGCKILSILKFKNLVLLYLAILLIITGTCFFAVLFYKVVEKPIISRLNNVKRIKVVNEI